MVMRPHIALDRGLVSGLNSEKVGHRSVALKSSTLRCKSKIILESKKHLLKHLHESNIEMEMGGTPVQAFSGPAGQPRGLAPSGDQLVHWQAHTNQNLAPRSRNHKRGLRSRFKILERNCQRSLKRRWARKQNRLAKKCKKEDRTFSGLRLRTPRTTITNSS